MPPGYNTVIRNHSMQHQQMMHNQFMNFTMRHVYGSQYLANPACDFILLLKDSTQLKVRSKVHSDTTLKKNYLVFVNKDTRRSDSNRKRMIFPEETLKITRVDLSPGVMGTPTDSCWLFKVVTGKINAYSFLPENYALTSDHLTAMQVGDGPIEPITTERLRALMAGDEKALKALYKKDVYKAITKFNASSK